MIYKIIFSLLLICTSAINLHAKNIVPELVFLDLFLKNDPHIVDYINEGELSQSRRLGITYAGTTIKFLLNYNVPEEVKSAVTNNNQEYNADVLRLEENYTVLEFALQDKSYSTKFYFKDGKCIAPVTYFTRNYSKDSSDFFEYYISNPLYFNSYCKQELDEFVASMIDIMMFTDAEKKLLEQKKITYVFCNTDDEIKDIIGQTARGVYLVGNDAVVSTYNTHNHEVSHLLMNYKIKNDIKPEHLFFLEGFATAFGGRGGLSTFTLLPVAQFSVNSGFVNVNSYLSMNDFMSEDASITYPVAGLYSLIYFVNKGFEDYLKTYLEFSGDLNYLNTIDSANTSLPFYSEFLEQSKNIIPNVIKIDFDKSVFKVKLIDEPDFKIYKRDEDCLILLKNNLLLKSPGESFEYLSKTFSEKFPGKEYLTYHYLIEASKDRVGIYDLFTNNLIFSYNKAFDMQQREVPMEVINGDEYFMLSIPYGLLSEGLNKYELSTLSKIE